VRDVYQVLKKINENGTTILLVEQNLHLALDICDRGYVMERGVIVLEGTSEDLKTEERVIEAYLGISSEID
jgi:branched-chain amino acid transport system ATP-binding protein